MGLLMRQALLNALEARYEAEVAEAHAIIKIFLENPVGIGEHPQHLDELDKQFEKIANLPSKEESLTVLAIMLNSPMQNFVNVLSSSMTKVVNVLEAVKNNKNIEN